jgi:adenylate cyclase
MTGDRQWEGDVAALNADVVGYSRLMADDFDATSEAMVAARSVVERGVSERGGRLVNFVGDNFMAVFDSARDGAQAAIEIASSLEESNAGLPSSRWLRFRMGMDRGVVAVAGEHFEGEVLNVAARIQALAPSGGLSVSGSVYRDLDEPALRFRPTGAHRLKNIPEPVEVYEFVDLPSDRTTSEPSSSLALEIPTVAVLPIHTEGVDDRVRSAAAVIRADMIHRLATIPELVVVDAGDAGEGGAVARGARYMLETGVHQFGDDLRVYATLFDVTTMNVVRSHKASSTVDEVLDLSDQMSEDVGTAVEVELVVGAPAGLYAELDDPAAIEKVYLGWYHLRSDTPEGWQHAIELFGEVAEAHPDLPYGWVLSGFANWVGAANDWANEPADALATARRQAQTGMSVGDQTGLGQAVDAAALMSMGRIDEAVDAMENLVIVRPTCDVTYGLEGSLKRYLGRWEEAIDLLDVAMRLTGINKPWYPTVKACSLFIGNRVEQAASVAESVLEYQPHNLEALLVLAAAQVELGLDRRANATAEQIRDQFRTVDVTAWLERSPYQDEAIVDRWKTDLSSLGLIPTP